MNKNKKWSRWNRICCARHVNSISPHKIARISDLWCAIQDDAYDIAREMLGQCIGGNMPRPIRLYLVCAKIDPHVIYQCESITSNVEVFCTGRTRWNLLASKCKFFVALFVCTWTVDWYVVVCKHAFSTPVDDVNDVCIKNATAHFDLNYIVWTHHLHVLHGGVLGLNAHVVFMCNKHSIPRAGNETLLSELI